jgi:molybdopterin converting factor small subunit
MAKPRPDQELAHIHAALLEAERSGLTLDEMSQRLTAAGYRLSRQSCANHLANAKRVRVDHKARVNTAVREVMTTHAPLLQALSDGDQAPTPGKNWGPITPDTKLSELQGRQRVENLGAMASSIQQSMRVEGYEVTNEEVQRGMATLSSKELSPVEIYRESIEELRKMMAEQKDNPRIWSQLSRTMNAAVAALAKATPPPPPDPNQHPDVVRAAAECWELLKNAVERARARA